MRAGGEFGLAVCFLFPHVCLSTTATATAKFGDFCFEASNNAREGLAPDNHLPPYCILRVCSSINQPCLSYGALGRRASFCICLDSSSSVVGSAPLIPFIPGTCVFQANQSASLDRGPLSRCRLPPMPSTRPPFTISFSFYFGTVSRMPNQDPFLPSEFWQSGKVKRMRRNGNWWKIGFHTRHPFPYSPSRLQSIPELPPFYLSYPAVPSEQSSRSCHEATPRERGQGRPRRRASVPSSPSPFFSYSTPFPPNCLYTYI
ncbi:hypothetical protein BDY21DRAFT_338736 [Lineolata rhizophorae]|uniref:Extracellular membrane protein CFEM domain-containing protein n=1 Tax=Lineolata rhizophorae TaxID=578093 RepID=A0A6A6P6L0_9PEZI|nr:hypothetical protein BDY21DRAFT_338736 [Lineolata rhizophorae]